MTDSIKLDLDYVRAQFPEACWDWAFFENAGGAFVPESVIRRMTSYMSECQVQPGYPFPLSHKAQERIDLGHHLMADMIGADGDEVVISASTSINVYVLAQALRPLWQAGDEIIITNLNHEANSGAWRRLAEFGLKIVEWPVHPDTGQLEIDLLDRLLSEKTRLVAFPHVSNITGDINDVVQITDKVHAAGAMVCVDGGAYAPHRHVDVKAWDVDFYLFSFYKVFGPHMGCLYGKRARLVEATNQYHYFIANDDTTHKLNPAGPNHESIAALAGIADYFDALAVHHFPSSSNTLFDRVGSVYEIASRHEEVLAGKFVDFITSKPGVRLLGRQTGDREARCATFGFTSDRLASAEIAGLVGAHKVAIANGNFYANRLLEALGIADIEDGVVRCSMAHYNTEDEVDQLIRVLDSIL
ncbi:MAG: aminotransferase class V-fold PLP-dependent enzyme [Rhodospirillales bacterium]|nr:aminotransferase class V-fold PLP-dependent enzyme [Rhodospirillales bacterium]